MALLRVSRFPLVTASVLAVTAATNIVQFLVPGTLSQLERTSAVTHSGEVWRIVTSLFVQDGGVFGTLSNLFFLLAVGTCAEQVVSRRDWLLCYFGIGLVTELIALDWQPKGGGNSIAVCGLTGIVAMALWRQTPPLPKFTFQLIIIWCGALLATWSTYLVAICFMGPALIQVAIGHNLPVGRLVAGAVAVTALVLVCALNIHGAALLISLGAAFLLVRRFPGAMR